MNTLTLKAYLKVRALLNDRSGDLPPWAIKTIGLCLMAAALITALGPWWNGKIAGIIAL